MIVNKEKREYNPALPSFYNKNKINEKICLTYFITVLYEKSRKSLDVLNINLLCMPNGELVDHYKERPLKAGKNKDKARFNFKEVNSFELLKNEEDNSRIKIIYMNEKCFKYENKLKFILNIKDKNKE